MEVNGFSYLRRFIGIHVLNYEKLYTSGLAVILRFSIYVELWKGGHAVILRFFIYVEL